MNLSKSADIAQSPMAGYPLPFTQEEDAHMVNTWVRVREPPLRFFKNDYDKPPVSHIPKRTCTIPPAEASPNLCDKAAQTTKEDGRDRRVLPEASLRSYQNAEPWIKKTLLIEDDDLDVDYYASIQSLCNMEDGAVP